MIVLIDDEEAILELTQDVLQAEGYTTRALPTGEAALEFLREHKDECELIIMDLVMPGMSGEELIRRILELTDCPIVVASGYQRDQYPLQKSDQIRAYLEKPFQVDRLVDVVQQLLEPTSNRSS